MFTLRRYEPADREAVAYLHVHAVQQAGAYLGRGPWDDDVYAIEEVYLKKRGEFLIGECDGLFVAMGALKRTSPEIITLARGCRGKRARCEKFFRIPGSILVLCTIDNKVC